MESCRCATRVFLACSCAFQTHTTSGNRCRAVWITDEGCKQCLVAVSASDAPERRETFPHRGRAQYAWYRWSLQAWRPRHHYGSRDCILATRGRCRVRCVKPLCWHQHNNGWQDLGALASGSTTVRDLENYPHIDEALQKKVREALTVHVNIKLCYQVRSDCSCRRRGRCVWNIMRTTVVCMLYILVAFVCCRGSWAVVQDTFPTCVSWMPRSAGP